MGQMMVLDISSYNCKASLYLKFYLKYQTYEVSVTGDLINSGCFSSIIN